MPAKGVRPGGRRDVEAIVALWVELLRHHAPLDPQYHLADGAEATWRDHLVRLLRAPGGAVFVHEHDRVLDGFAVVETARAAPVFSETVRAEITAGIQVEVLDQLVRAAPRCCDVTGGRERY